MTINKLALFALAGACLVVGGALAEDIDDNPIEMPRDVVSAATAFQAYMKNAAEIGDFSNSSSVAQSVRTGASYQPAQLEEGMIAYGAIAALQDEGFVNGVERAAGRGDARQALAERLVEDPAAATQIDGAAGAAKRIEAALGARAQPLTEAGTAVKAAAYTVQHQAWSREMVDDAQGRLAEVKRLSAAIFQPTDSDNDAMVQALVEMNPQVGADDAPAGFTAIEARALALAAEAVLGRAHSSDRANLSPLLTDTNSAMCLRMAKLNLYQCMAVAGPQYEDMFCLGQHAMMDTASCVNEATHGHVGRIQVASATPIASGGGGYVHLASHHSFRVDPGE
jgi:hypothetical protein